MTRTEKARIQRLVQIYGRDATAESIMRSKDISLEEAAEMVRHSETVEYMGISLSGEEEEV